MDFIEKLYRTENKRKRRTKNKHAKRTGLKSSGNYYIIKDTGIKYHISTSQYCAISREKLWQQWLGQIAPDLQQQLQQHLANSKGCRSNNTKMIEIQNELSKRGHMSKLIYFLEGNYPTAVKKYN